MLPKPPAEAMASVPVKSPAGKAGWPGPYGRALDGRPLLVPVVILVVWELAVQLGYVDPLFLAAPSQVLTALVEAWRSGVAWRNTVASLVRIGIGYGIAASTAIPLGLALGYSERLRGYLSGLLELLRPVPPISLIPVAILWLGIGTASKVGIIVYATFWPILLNTILGVQEIPPILRRAARTLGLNGLSYFTKVVLPASLPQIMVGLRISAGIAFVVVVAAEMVAAPDGLGFMILDAQRTFKTPEMFGGILMLAVLGSMTNTLLIRLERRFTTWRV